MKVVNEKYKQNTLLFVISIDIDKWGQYLVLWYEQFYKQTKCQCLL